MDYEQFLISKQVNHPPSGLIVDPSRINPILFDWQRAIVLWALKRGKAALFEECGLGKTFQQIEWARIVYEDTGGDILMLAPLAVNTQTVKEGEKLGVSINSCRTQADVKPGLNITNYEMLEHFDPSAFGGIVIDESSILKSFTGTTRNLIIELFNQTPYKLACTATPAPNDHMELGNHAEFLGIMSRVEMLSMYFVHDAGDTAKWRLKGHAEESFWKWLASWSVTIRKPSDLGFSDEGFVLPKLNMYEHITESETPEGALYATEAQGLMARRQARRSSLHERVKDASDTINEIGGQWIVWCDLNDEGELLANSIEGAVNIQGSDSPARKSQSMMDFTDGKIQILVTKPSIAGFGMNWQHCYNVAFVGLSDSWEMYYQAIRRCLRFGQNNEVNCHIFISEREGAVLKNIQRKERDALKMGDEVIRHMKDLNEIFQSDKEHNALDYVRAVYHGEGFELHRSDCVDAFRERESNSIDYVITSPPFASLYTYSNSERDMGNCLNYDEFCVHFQYLIKELYRTLKPGRLISLHCFDIPAMKQRDGFIGLIDFPSDLRAMFMKEGFIYHSKVTIWKDPVVQMQRTKAIGLLHKQIRKDSSMSRQGLADYVVTMRKPGDNPEPIYHYRDEAELQAANKGQEITDEMRARIFPVDQWQQYASPVWMDINPSNTLNGKGARDEKDERHICPLQLEVIERAMELWSNPGDTVADPYNGIGSTGYVALKSGRKYFGSELKESYYQQSVKYLERAVSESGQLQMEL